MNLDLPLDLERELVSAALAFRAAEPWRELANSDYLLVEDGTRGARALSVLGNGGQQYGLQAYAAECAMEWLALIDQIDAMPTLAPTAMFELLDGESLELGSKKEADTRDLARLKRAGYQPALRTRMAWPMFRQFRPAHFPWHVEEAAARRLIGDLARARRWAELAPGLEGRDPDVSVVLRKLPLVAADLTTERAWTAADLRWVPLKLPAQRSPAPLAVDAAELAAWRKLPRKAGEWLWVDERPQMMQIRGEAGGAPYFPRLAVCLDGRSGMAFPPGMGPAARPYGTSAREALGQALRFMKGRPAEVRTPNMHLAGALEPWLRQADIVLKVQKEPPELEQLWAMLG